MFSVIQSIIRTKTQSGRAPVTAIGSALLLLAISGAGNAGLPAIEAVSPASALTTAPAIKLETRVNAYKVVTDVTTRQERLEPITASTALVSGDTLEYQGVFSNVAPDRIRSVRVGLSIPDNVTVIEGSIDPRAAFGSVNNQQFIRMPLQRQLDGKLVKLPLSYYKGLQWNLKDIDLNGSKMVRYRATLN